jgi:LacI family transcriptional regulator
MAGADSEAQVGDLEREAVGRQGTSARVTIVDVAREAGVGPSTVSKALNDGRGSAAVRRRVEDAAARLGYRPNQRARGLRRSESRSIGVLIPDLGNPVFLPFLRAVEHAAQARGYVVLIADGQRSDAAEADALERFFDQGVDGLLLAGPVTADSLRPYLDHGIPVAPSASPTDRAVAGHWERAEAAATGEMTQRLLALGHRSFLFVRVPGIKGREGRRYRRSRLGALSTALDDAGAQLAVTVVDPTRGREGGIAALRAAVTEHRPTAVVCATHLLAPWLLNALDDARLRLPDDVSIVVYGDSDWARAYQPPLSVVSHDTYAEGLDLATGLLDTIRGETTRAAGTVEARFVERGTCGPPPPPSGA